MARFFIINVYTKKNLLIQVGGLCPSLRKLLLADDSTTQKIADMPERDENRGPCVWAIQKSEVVVIDLS
jgi:hypothetical protein